MELVSLVKEVLQSGAELAASYRLGQSALQYMDRALRVVEKCARWAVPPPLEQDERPQPELVRPLPWVFFLVMLVILRITRESISLLNLVMGKPPLRSADVVMYMQSKRRQLRALQYAGTRLARARPPAAAGPALADLLRLCMCFRRQPPHANNNTTQVVKRSKRGREKSSPVVSGSETTMERLIEKMMVDLDADSDEDSSFTLTNLTSPKSDRSECTTESDQDTFHNHTQTTQESPVKPQEEPQTTQNETQLCQVEPPTTPKDTNSQGEILQEDISTTQNDVQHQEEVHTTRNDSESQKELSITPFKDIQQSQKEVSTIENETQALNILISTRNNIEYECENKEFNTAPEKKKELEYEDSCECNEIPKDLLSSADLPIVMSPKEETQEFLQTEATSKIPRTSNNEPKITNGRTAKSGPSKKKGAHAHEKHRRHERGAKSVSTNNSV